MEEIWKDIKGYEGFYQISNLGRVRGLDRIVEMWAKRKGTLAFIRFHVKGKMLSANRIVIGRGNDKGYVKYRLTDKNKKVKQLFAHKLVAEAFIPNPENKPQVDHIDADSLNNKVSNLRWVTPSENNSNPLTKLKRKERRNK